MKEQAWAYFSPSPSGKRCVHKVTVDYFLGKRQSQGGVADKCIFCNQSGEVQGKVKHVWQLPNDKRNNVVFSEVLFAPIIRN